MKDEALSYNHLDGQFDDPEDDHEEEKSNEMISTNQNMDRQGGKYISLDSSSKNKKHYQSLLNNLSNINRTKVNKMDQNQKNETNISTSMIPNGNRILKSNDRSPYETMSQTKPTSFVSHILQFAQKSLPSFSTFSKTSSSFHSSPDQLPNEIKDTNQMKERMTNSTNTKISYPNYSQRQMDLRIQNETNWKSNNNYPHLQSSQKHQQARIQTLQKSQWQPTIPTRNGIDQKSNYLTNTKEISNFSSDTKKNNIHNYNITSKPIIDPSQSEFSSLKKNMGADSFTMISKEGEGKRNEGENTEIIEEPVHNNLSSNFSTFIRPFSSPESSTINASRNYISNDSSHKRNESISSSSELICTENIKNNDSPGIESVQHLSYQALSTTSLPNPPNICYAGSIPLGLEQDKYWLSELHCYLRSNFAELFAAKPEDITVLMHGRNKPIAVGQVGVRCIHCKNEPISKRGQQAISYPSFITGIYNSVQQMLRLHFDTCLAMPKHVRDKIEALKSSSSARGGRKQYWVDSAKRLGLMDTSAGIHFTRDPYGPLPALGGPSGAGISVQPKVNYHHSKTIHRKMKIASDLLTPYPSTLSSNPVTNNIKSNSYMNKPNMTSNYVIVEKNKINDAMIEKGKVEDKTKDETKVSGTISDDSNKEDNLDALGYLPKHKIYPLVVPEDKSLITNYLYMTLEQMQPCNLTEADRVGCYKGRKIGFPGIACLHCVGQAGCGRYFPASEASLSQTTTSQTIMNHVRNCRRCPIEIRQRLDTLRNAKFGPSYKTVNKPKHGGRKVFFHRLWCRIQRIEIEGEEDIVDYIAEKAEMRKALKTPQKKKSSNTSLKRKQLLDFSTNESNVVDEKENDNHSQSYNSDNHSEKSDGNHVERVKNLSKTLNKEQISSPRNNNNRQVLNTRQQSLDAIVSNIPLHVSDEWHCLSEHDILIRKQLCEFFTVTESNLKLKRKNDNVSIGQVGVRCKICAHVPVKQRTKDSVCYPSSLSNICKSTRDLIKKHISICPKMQDSFRVEFEALSKSIKKPDEIIQQYWIDSAKELGVANRLDGGIMFVRDPKSQSPVDQIREFFNSNKPNQTIINRGVLSPKDKDQMTDFVALLLLQVQRCKFKKGDVRKGTGSHRRDRKIGYPGLACIYCADKNNFGRFFPYSAKGLAEYTTLSIHAHLNTCELVPQEVKSSLAYLSHKRILQKTELKNGWKKSFYKKLWDRLHDINHSDDDKSIDTEQDNDEDDESMVTKNSFEQESLDRNTNNDENTSAEENDSDWDISDIIEEAALWLWKNDQATEPSKTRRGKALAKASKGRGRDMESVRRDGGGNRKRARLA